jgi:hypothetical protein
MIMCNPGSSKRGEMKQCQECKHDRGDCCYFCYLSYPDRCIDFEQRGEMKEKICEDCANFDASKDSCNLESDCCVDFIPMEPESALDKQVGGSHYKDYVIQPREFEIKNQIPTHKGSIFERILRYDHPTGKGLEDLLKIKHEVDLIIEIEGWKE